MAVVKLTLESTNGELDLTEFLNVQEGEGMDPADPEFTTKVFAHSLLKQGATLALEDLKLREMTFPLRLKGTSKDALTQLVREINTILNTPGCMAAWQDEGASRPTYLELASGQLDPQFKYRQGEHNFLPCKLRLFCQPLGLIEKEPRVLLMAGTEAAHGATRTGTAPVMTFYPGSPVRGDVGALVTANARLGSGGATANPWTTAFSVLPAASYTPWRPMGFATQGWKASSAEGFTYSVGRSLPNAARIFDLFAAEGANGYSHRILALARLLNSASPAKMAVEWSPSGAGASGAAGVTVPPIPEVGSWPPLIDCGVVSLPSAHTGNFELEITTTATISLYGLVILPDDRTTWLRAAEGGAAREMRYIGAGARIEDAFENEFTSQVRGAIPLIPPGPTPAPLAFLSVVEDANAPAPFSCWFDVLERCRYTW